MSKPAKTTIKVRGTEITILAGKTDDYISLTDIDPGVNPLEFDGIRKQAGLNRFVLTPSSSAFRYPSGFRSQVSGFSPAASSLLSQMRIEENTRK